MAYLGAMVFAIALYAGQAQAVVIKTANPDLNINFTSTFTYSTMFRVADQDPALIAAANADDGDRNFDKGLVMNRLDLFSEFDLSYNKFGFRVTGQAFYDTVYNKKNDNDSPGTVNHDISVVPYNKFTEATRKLQGSDGELMEAFTFGSLYLGNTELSYKVGQYSLFWGHAFFPGSNGIAEGMSPINVAKCATLPSAQMKDVILPVPQASVDWQVTNDLSFGAYYQFKWRGVRLWGSGSYFSPVDLLIEGGDRIIGPGFIRTTDDEPKDSGQYGLQAKYQSKWGVDFGAYALNYHSKGPSVVVKPIELQYYLYYPEDIKAYGVSANTSIGIVTIAGEINYRQNVPLVSQDIAVFPAFVPGLPHEPQYAVGNTLHANVNFFMPNLPANFISDSGTFIFETSWNTRLSVTEHEELLATGKTKGGWKIKLAYEPKWFQFLSAFDLITPIGVEYTPQGLGSVQDTGPHKGGMWTVGVGGTYDNKWDVLLTYVNYYGDTKYQSIADRDYVGFSLRRAF